MKKELVEQFINRFSKIYYKEYTITDGDINNYGIPKGLNQTNRDLENYIIDNKLDKGIYDAESFAWKAGKADWKAGHIDYKMPLPNKWVNGNGGEIKLRKDDKAFTKDDFEKYVEKNRIDLSQINYAEMKDRRKLYIDIKEKYNLYNYGTVNIINQMFFLSKGAIPLYDYYAHLGVKALFMGKAPIEIYISNSPSKDEHPKGKDKINKVYYSAINILEEYMWLLEKVFPDEIYKKGKYISRELDQALWVYGHASIKFDESKI